MTKASSCVHLPTFATKEQQTVYSVTCQFMPDHPEHITRKGSSQRSMEATGVLFMFVLFVSALRDFVKLPGKAPTPTAHVS